MNTTSDGLIVRHAHVLDPGTGLDGIADVRLSSGRIAEIGENLRGSRELDADGLHLFPGLVDVHAHWRTPGREDEENIESGSAAAAAGGFTSVVMMPNTDPIVDRPVIVSGLARRIEKESRIRAYISAALHEGLSGERLTEMRLLKEAGAFCVSDDGLGTASAEVLRNGMIYARTAGLPVILHCEDHDLSTGVVHDGAAAALAGVSGMPASAEDTATATGLILAAETGGESPHHAREYRTLRGVGRLLQRPGGRHRRHDPAPSDPDGKSDLHPGGYVSRQPAATPGLRPARRRSGIGGRYAGLRGDGPRAARVREERASVGGSRAGFPGTRDSVCGALYRACKAR